eukprot:PhF_6_TR14946/c0_g1_i1/m.23438/K04986/PKD2; polycystin 2
MGDVEETMGDTFDTFELEESIKPHGAESAAPRISTENIRQLILDVAELAVETPTSTEIKPYFMMLFCLSLSVLASRSVGKQAPSYHMGTAVRQAYFADYTPTRQFRQIENAEEFWKWAYVAIPSMGSSPNVAPNVLLGGVKIWTLRASETPCDPPIGFKPRASNCHAVGEPTLADVDKEFSETWPNSSLVNDGDRNQENEFRGISRPITGFTLDVPRTTKTFSSFYEFNSNNISIANITKWLSTLESIPFVDSATRAVGVQFIMQNSPIGKYGAFIGLFEIGASGFVRPSSYAYIFSFPTFVAGKPTMLEGFLIFLFVLILIWVIFEARFQVHTVLNVWELYHNVAHFLTIWNLVSYASIAMFVTMFTFLFQTWNIAHKITSISSENTEALHDAYVRMAYADSDFWTFYSVTVFVAWLRLFRFMEHVPRLCMLTQTVRNASGELFSVSLILLVLITGYGLMAFVLYGSSLEGFSTLSGSYGSLFLLLFGDYTSFYTDMYESHPASTVFFFSTFFFLGWILMLNMVLAVITESFYSTAGLEKKSAVNRTTLFDLLGNLFSVIHFYISARFSKSNQRDELKKRTQKLLGRKTPVNEIMLRFRKTITNRMRIRQLVRMAAWLDSIVPPRMLTFSEFQRLAIKFNDAATTETMFHLTERQWKLLETYWKLENPRSTSNRKSKNDVGALSMLNLPMSRRIGGRKSTIHNVMSPLGGNAESLVQLESVKKAISDIERAILHHVVGDLSALRSSLHDIHDVLLPDHSGHKNQGTDPLVLNGAMRERMREAVLKAIPLLQEESVQTGPLGVSQGANTTDDLLDNDSRDSSVYDYPAVPGSPGVPLQSLRDAYGMFDDDDDDEIYEI